MGGQFSGKDDAANPNGVNPMEAAQRAAHERAMASLRRREAEAMRRVEVATEKAKQIEKERGEFKKT